MKSSLEGEGAESYERVHRGPSSILCLSWDTLYVISHKYTFFLVTSSLFLRGYLSRPVWQLWTGLKYSWYNRHDISFLTMMIKTTMMMKLFADDRWKMQPLHLRSAHSKHCAPQQGRLSRLSTLICCLTIKKELLWFHTVCVKPLKIMFFGPKILF